MARPKKNNAEYFSHDSGMRNHRKIKSIRSRFGIQGYALYCMFLECLTDSDNLEMDYSDIEIEFLAGDFCVKYQEMQQFLEYCISINIFKLKDNKIYSSGLKERLSPVFEKRKRERERRNNYKSTVSHDVANCGRNSKIEPLDCSSGVLCPDEVVSVAETPQSKVKESKVNKSKEKNKEKEKTDKKENQSVLVFLEENFKVDKNQLEYFKEFINQKNYTPDIERLSIQILQKIKKEVEQGLKVGHLYKYFRAFYQNVCNEESGKEAEKQYELVKNPSTRNSANIKATEIYKNMSRYFREMSESGICFYADGNVNVKAKFIKEYKTK